MQMINRLFKRKPKKLTYKERIALEIKKVNLAIQLNTIASIVGEHQDWEAIQSELSTPWLAHFSSTFDAMMNNHNYAVFDAKRDHHRAVADIIQWRDGEPESDELNELVKTKLALAEQEKNEAIATTRYRYSQAIKALEGIFINMMNAYKERQNAEK